MTNPTDFALMLAVLIAALSVPLAVAMWTRLHRDRMRYELALYEEDRSRHRLSKEESTESPKFPRTDESLHELPYVLLRIERMIEALHHDVQKEHSFAPAPTQTGNQSVTILVRQLSHSLGTPLSRIKADALALRDASDTPAESDRIIAAVDLSQAYLESFRRLATLEERKGILDDKNLAQEVSQLLNVYRANEASGPQVSVDLPKNIPGYQNTFLLAVMAPLLENAVEACPSEGEIVVDHELNSHHTIRVSNTDNGEPIPDDPVLEGCSSKSDHDGLGLSVARTLLHSRGMGGFDIKQQHGKVIVSFSLT